MRKIVILSKVWSVVKRNYVFVVLASFLWLAYRTGTKPSRIAYPCQQAALANIGFFVYLLPAFYIHRFVEFLRSEQKTKTVLRGIVIVVATLMVFSLSSVAVEKYEFDRSVKEFDARDKGPTGIRTVGGFMTTPPALLLPSPHRVVSVHDRHASSWTGSGNPHLFLNQSAIDVMVSKGVMELSEESSAQAAWASLIPYQEGEAVAIKLNFNNAQGGCTSAWSNDHYMNPYAELVNNVIEGLVSIGVPSEMIWLTDPSRLPPDAFRNRIMNNEVRYYTKCTPAQIAQREDVFSTGFVSDDSPFSTLSEAAPSITHWVNPAEVFVDADHIINIPQLKGHGGASITLGLKNHFGSVDFTSNAWGSSPLHSYFYINGNQYHHEYNLLADINDNPVFKNKTRLVIGDGLYAHSTINYQNPHTWTSFEGRTPAILFFGVDPVAVDSVMADYLIRENLARGQSVRNTDILVYSATIGLGVFESWDSPDTRDYESIDYVEVDYDTGLCKNCLYSLSENTCSDGTLYQECSSNQPLFCDQGILVENCSVCGCEQGFECLNGECVIVDSSYCGDGIVQQPNSQGFVEGCDDADDNADSCTPLYNESCSYCSMSCQLITVPIQDFCGDGVVQDEYEHCDGMNLTGESCFSLGFSAGSLSCSLQCDFDTSLCSMLGDVNGDGVVDLLDLLSLNSLQELVLVGRYFGLSS